MRHFTSLTIGTQLSSFKITALLGKGGMGEVYRAHDSKLKRDVAIKILPEEFSRDHDRVSRFQREAEVLASPNHTNIAGIYDLQEASGSRFLVLELVEGETLADRIARGPVPVDEALAIAKQVAEALEAAHEKGIVHRDLKPANVKILPDGKVKVLDFGLAKAIEPQTSGSGLSNSPTLLSSGQTQANVLLGTLPYMSPEQLRGRAADERSDIWAFGCVLYEMLTGRQPFRVETVTDLSAEIVRIEPDWNALPAGTPAAVRSVVKLCLEKDRRQRFHAIGDVRIRLEEEQKTPIATTAPVPKSRERLPWATAAIFALFAIGVLIAAIYFYPRPAPLHASRFLIEIPPDANIGAATVAPYPTVSPDGRYVAFIADSGGGFRLWLRPVDSLNAQQLPGTEVQIGGGNSISYYFWSPDSRFIGFFANGKLKKIAPAGGPPQSLCDVSGETLSGTWNQNDIILLEHQGSLHRVGAAGGVSTPVRKPDKSKNEVSYKWPSFLPDGQHFVYLAMNSEQGRSEVRVGALDSTDDRPLFAANSRVLYAGPGYLLFVRDGTLMAQPFDARRLSLSGDIFPAAEQVKYLPANGNAAFSVSTNGTLIFQKGNAAETNLTWFDRSGKKLGSIPPGPFQQATLSPDQNRIVVERRDSGSSDIWLIDLLRGTNSRCTFDPANDIFPVFSPDGKQIAFVSSRSGKNDLYIKAASGLGAEERIQEGMGGVSDWSPDGKFLLPAKSLAGNWDIWVLPMTGDRKPYPLLNQKFFEYRGKFSPDGHWILYTSNETGRNEIYVQAFPPSGGVAGLR